jgi:hypothetical protein
MFMTFLPGGTSMTLKTTPLSFEKQCCYVFEKAEQPSPGNS